MKQEKADTSANAEDPPEAHGMSSKLQAAPVVPSHLWPVQAHSFERRADRPAVSIDLQLCCKKHKLSPSDSD